MSCFLIVTKPLEVLPHGTCASYCTIAAERNGTSAMHVYVLLTSWGNILVIHPPASQVTCVFICQSLPNTKLSQHSLLRFLKTHNPEPPLLHCPHIKTRDQGTTDKIAESSSVGKSSHILIHSNCESLRHCTFQTPDQRSRHTHNLSGPYLHTPYHLYPVKGPLHSLWASVLQIRIAQVGMEK
jgi:hypothetical protein